MNRKTDKKDFLELYKLCKNGKIDLNTLDSETIHKLSILASEDLKIHQNYIDKHLKSCTLKFEKIKSYKI